MQFTEVYTDEYNKNNSKPVYNVIDPSYFNTIYKNISYEFNNLFTPEDSTTIGLTLHNLGHMDRDYSEIFNSISNDQDTKNIPEAGGNYYVWYKKGDKKTHVFSNVFAKLICCIGKTNGENKELELAVPILTDNGIEFQPKTFYIKKEICKNINGEDFDDDNSTEVNAKPACLDFMVKYCLFLKKYNSDKEYKPNTSDLSNFLQRFCPCIINDPKLHGKDPNSVLRTLEIGSTKNVRCAVTECNENENAYKPKLMRENTACRSIVDCSIAIGNVKMTDDAKLNIDQKCTSEGQEAAEKTTIAGEEVKKVEEEAKEEIKKEFKKEIEEEQETTQTQEQKISNEPTFFYNIINFFRNLFGLNKENFTNSNFSYFNLFYFIFSSFIIYLFIFNDPYKLKKYIKLKF